MQSSLEEYYSNEYGNYIVPAAFSMPKSSPFLDHNAESVNFNEWLRYELNLVKSWIEKMPGTSDFTDNDHDVLFKSSSLLLVFLKVAVRSAHLHGHLELADGINVKLNDFDKTEIAEEVAQILRHITDWLDEILIDPLEFCLLGSVLYAYPFLEELELPEVVHKNQENGILNIIAYNKLNSRRFGQLCRLIHHLDYVRKVISASPALMGFLSEWDVISTLADISLES